MATQCPFGCCAPSILVLDDAGTPQWDGPVGPYLCQDNDGFGYTCCNGGQTCFAGAGCCMTHQNGSNICVVSCTDDNQCGVGHCVNYVGPASGSTCVGNKACGP